MSRFEFDGKPQFAADHGRQVASVVFVAGYIQVQVAVVVKAQTRRFAKFRLGSSPTVRENSSAVEYLDASRFVDDKQPILPIDRHCARFLKETWLTSRLAMRKGPKVTS